MSSSKVPLACVAWRFCRAGRRSGVAAKFAREARENERRSRKKNKVAPAPISSQFLCPRPPLLLSAPNQNRHATQAKVPWSWFSSFSLTGLSRERFGSLPQFKDVWRERKKKEKIPVTKEDAK